MSQEGALWRDLQAIVRDLQALRAEHEAASDANDGELNEYDQGRFEDRHDEMLQDLQATAESIVERGEAGRGVLRRTV